MTDLKTIEPNTEAPIEINYKLLSADILKAVIEEFVLREGTNYGDIDYSLEQKVLQVHKQIEKGDVKIIFDQTTESVTLLPRRSI